MNRIEPGEDEVEAAAALLHDFQRVIATYRGRAMAPASELPRSLDDIRIDIGLLRERRPSLRADAALVELASFVADEEADGDLAYESYYRANPRVPWREIRERWPAEIENRKRVAAARSEAAWQVVDSARGFAVADKWKSDPSGFMPTTIGSAYDTLVHRRAEGKGVGSDRADGFTLLVLIAWSGIAGTVASVLAMWFLGKSLWWTLIAVIPLLLLPLAALLAGEAIVARILRWPRLARLAETTSWLAAAWGWLPFAALVAVVAPPAS